jgi:L-lysine 2,3-aminomutase
VIALSKRGRELGKQVCLHTHINHPNEITWITRKAAQRLFQEGVIVRNQSVLLKGVNDDNETMGKLIKDLADINIQPVSALHHEYKPVMQLTVLSTTSINVTLSEESKILELLSALSLELTNTSEEECLGS